MKENYWDRVSWRTYPKWLLKKVNELERLQNTCLFVRHSARDEPDRIEDTHAAQLTDEGKEGAYQFGQELNPKFTYRIYHSQVERCKETAHLIKKGAQDAGMKIVEIQGCEELNMILSDEKALMPLLSRDQEPFLYYWIAGFYPLHRVESTLSLATRIQELIYENLQSNDNEYLDIYVTHDFQILILLFHCAGIINFKHWVYYLDGFLWHLKEKTIEINFHHEQREIYPPAWWKR